MNFFLHNLENYLGEGYKNQLVHWSLHSSVDDLLTIVSDFTSLNLDRSILSVFDIK